MAVSIRKPTRQWVRREALRSKGQFWTPDWVAEAMAAYVVADEAVILDPAVGKGAFYLATMRLASEKGLSVRFHGTDIDPTVMAESRSRCTSASAQCTFEVRDFLLDPPQGRYHAIIANPPYIRHHRMTPELKARLQALALRVTGARIDGRAGMHVFFLIQALSMLEQNGRLAFIMPADTGEGVFARRLWAWIGRDFRLDGVITFTPEATPFPRVDTNPIVFFISRSDPADSVAWVRCLAPSARELREFVESSFSARRFDTLEVISRKLTELQDTGPTREPRAAGGNRFRLSDFARVMRGIATGANEFFWLTAAEASRRQIPPEFLVPALGRTRDVTGDTITASSLSELANQGRPTLLFTPDGRRLTDFPQPVRDYLADGEEGGLPNRTLISTRRPWYKMETRPVPPFLFAYLGRRNARFIRNEAGVIPLTGFLCVYPRQGGIKYADRLWFALHHPDTARNLRLVGKSYGSGAIKVEPRALERLPIPDAVVEQAGLAELPPRSDRALTMDFGYEFAVRDAPAATYIGKGRAARRTIEPASRRRRTGKPGTSRRKRGLRGH